MGTGIIFFFFFHKYDCDKDFIISLINLSVQCLSLFRDFTSTRLST